MDDGTARSRNLEFRIISKLESEKAMLTEHELFADHTNQSTTTQGRIRQKVDMLVMNLQTAAIGGMTEDECKMVLRGALEIQALLPA